MLNRMIGIRLSIVGIFSFFKVPYNSLLMDSYLFPPKTTIVGMIGAAMGWNEERVLDDIDKFKYGLIIKNPGERAIETATIFGNIEYTPYPITKIMNYKSYPITKIMNYKPFYEVYIASDNKDLNIDKIYDALNDPKFTLYLGDSESLFYADFKHPKFCEKIEINKDFGNEFECILPSEIYNKKERIEMTTKKVIPPTEIKIPINFTGKGKNRKCVLKNVFYYSGIKVKLKESVETYYYGKQPVCLF